MVMLHTNRSAGLRARRVGRGEFINAPCPEAGAPARARERGALMTELMVAIAILAIAIFPLAYSFMQEHRFLRSCYNRAVAMEIVDGEVEVLQAGEWRSFKEGAQDYTPHAQAATNLTAGKFQLTLADRRLRLEW